MENEKKSPIIFTILWYLIFAALIYFVNFSILNYICLFMGMAFLSTSVLEKDTSRAIIKVVLEILLFVVYFYR